jgi:hypothetical protein
VRPTLLLPLGLLGAGLGLVRDVGGAGIGVVATAGQVVAELLDEAAETLSAPPTAPSPTPPPAAATGILTAKMESLLARALEQSTASAQDELFDRILDDLVPDEARILGSLSDGSASPMVSVHALTPAGMLGEALVERAALVGRTANVALPRLTPTYVGRLLALGLVEAGPEDPALKDEYQVLLAETDVLAAIRTGSRGPVPARVVRRTLQLSPLGHTLWATCFGDAR